MDIISVEKSEKLNHKKVDSRHSSINERIGGEEQYFEETEGDIEDVDQLLINRFG